MVILSAKDIGKSYGEDTILKDVSFHINEGDRIGIVGANGSGKTTLLNILTGEIPADSGGFFISGNKTTGYLRQTDNFDRESTLYREIRKIFKPLEDMEREMTELSIKISEGEGNAAPLMDRYARLQDAFRNMGGYSYRSEINGVLNSMAFSEAYYHKEIRSLSGGERTKLSLACLLLEKPDILFLDEPTNHLDIETLEWLEQYLKAYRGTLVIVSHDRYFLDRITTGIFEIENHRLRAYKGNYSAYAEKKRKLREAEIRAYDRQQAEISRQEDMIRRFKERGTEKLAKRAASREKRLAAVERLQKPEQGRGKMKIHFHQAFQSGRDVFYGEGLGKTFGAGPSKKEVFRNVSFEIKRGEHVCLVGANGIGKTTLLRILTEKTEPTEGFLRIGHNVEFGCYDQEQRLLNNESSIIDEVHDSCAMYGDSEIRSFLGRFLFKNDRVFLKVGALSGGEKARLSLLKLMLSEANVLILDEPTNHLDIDSKEILEDALLDYPGTVVAVSHDRYFLNKIPDRILELSKDGLTEYLGAYDYYTEKKGSILSGGKYPKDPGGGENAEGRAKRSQRGGKALSAAEERRAKKQKEAEERRRIREKERLEKLINTLEAEIADCEAEMGKPENLLDHQLLEKLDKKQREKTEKLDKAYENWLELQ